MSATDRLGTKLAFAQGMKEYAPGIESTDLSLVDVQTTAGDAAEPVADAAPLANAETVHATTALGAAEPARALTPVAGTDAVPAVVATGIDRYLAKAIEEHAAGHVDRTLWERAIAQAGGDNARAKNIYLQSRATAIRVTRREKRAARYAQVVDSLSKAPEPGLEPVATEVDAATAAANNARRAIVRRNRVRATVAAGVFVFLGVAVVVVMGLVVVPSSDDPVGQEITASTKPRFNVFARAPATAAKPATTAPATPAEQTPPGEDFVGRLPALKKQGNWNVVVLYAVEWTRKQPDNAVAWKELSQGYLKLRQDREAQDAATKAVQLAPDNFLLWQNLGHVNLVVQAPMEALKAFHQAAVLNDHDVVSLVQAGLLHAQFGQLPDARTAFDKALAVNPQNVPALCGATSVAQREGRVKDAQAMARQVASLAERCSEAGDGASVRVAAGESAREKMNP